MLNNLTNTAYVQPAESQVEEKTAKYWDKIAQESEQNRCRSMLIYSESLYNLEKDDAYKQLEESYASIYEYVFKKFGRSKASTIQTIGVYKKYVVELGCTIEQLVEVGIGKLSIMCSKVTEDNIEETLSDMAEMSQKELSDKVKESEGLSPNQSVEEDTVEGTKQSSLKFKAPCEMIDAIKAGLAIASDTMANMSQYYSTGKDVPPAAALEYIIADWLTGADYDGKAYVNLERALNLLEKTYNIKLTYTDVEENL